MLNPLKCCDCWRTMCIVFMFTTCDTFVQSLPITETLSPFGGSKILFIVPTLWEQSSERPFLGRNFFGTGKAEIWVVVDICSFQSHFLERSPLKNCLGLNSDVVRLNTRTASTCSFIFCSISSPKRQGAALEKLAPFARP